MLLLLFLVSTQCSIATKAQTRRQTRRVLLRSACNGLSDGLRYIKPSADSVVLPVLCSNGFVMLSPSLNLNRYLEFLKTLHLPPSTTFGVAPNCASCTAVSDTVAADLQTNSVWTPSLTLDNTDCACYKPAASDTYRVPIASLPRVNRRAILPSPVSEHIVFDDSDDDTAEIDGVASSCLGLSDGEHLILPTKEVNGSMPVLRVTCSNGWTILNPALDPLAVPMYFSSWLDYTDSVAGPSLDDFASWRDWLVPADDNTLFTTSPDCSSCEMDLGLDAEGGVYHMTGNYYLCAWGTKGDCDMDLDANCFSCVNRHGGADYLEWMSGTCTHLAATPDTKVYSHHDDCTGMSDNSKPSLGTSGHHCVCYQPHTTRQPLRHRRLSVRVPLSSIDESTVVDDSLHAPIVRLSAADFADGTVRITSSGTYILDEDISFEPNPALDDEMANDPFAYGWFPTLAQDAEGTYKTGFADGTFIGEYQLGFMAAITIECSDVVVDLNGHRLEQSRTHYLQQRFFSVILLNNKNFIEGQGPVFFGAEMTTVANVVIRNGVIGRSSHHGILARQTRNLLVEDVAFEQFDVAGVSLSGFEGVILRNLEIGPNSIDCPVTGRYLHARAMLPRYKHLLENHADEHVTINGEKRQVRDLVDDVIDAMDLVYRAEVLGQELTDDEKFVAREFINEDRLSDGGAVYGVLLNGYGGAVMGFGEAPPFAADVTMENVHVHDLVLKPIEKCKFALSSSPFSVRGPFADVFDADMASYVDEDGLLHYAGSPFADAQLAFAVKEQSWSSLSHTDMGKQFQAWTRGEVALHYEDDVRWSCNTDIQLHVNKGPIGVRVDGVSKVRVEDLSVARLSNLGELGDVNKCGSYLRGNGHQDSMLQLGYTGTDSYGVVLVNADDVFLDSALKIDGVESHHGIATGLLVLRDATLRLGENARIAISNVSAGTALPMSETDTPITLSLPNKVPEACAVQLNLGHIAYPASSSSIDEHVTVDAATIEGHTLCEDSLHLNEADLVEVASACRDGLELTPDGVAYILPYGIYDADTFPLLPVRCDGDATILDASLSFERYQKYFSSLYLYDTAIAGPALDDFVSWREWFLPVENRDVKQVFAFGTSEDCSMCELASDDLTPSPSSAYYMSGNFYLCAWATKGDCDMDSETLECRMCRRSEFGELLEGACSHLVRSVDEAVHSDHYQCTGSNDNVKPSLGTDGRFCSCFEPQAEDVRVAMMQRDRYDDAVADINEKWAEAEAAESAALQSVENSDDSTEPAVTYLSQDDFASGTYRITEPGVYVLTEDIVVEFNPPTIDEESEDSFSANSYDALHWLPKIDGSQDDEYMGASTWSGPYQLGFFSAITIETHDVVLELNSFSIAMSRRFYIQQRFFALIELAAKNFVSGQGPVDFGAYLRSAHSVTIRNGALGLTSHHGIHANGASDVILEQLHIHSFDVAGIQLNGFEDVTIRDCEVHNVGHTVPLSGRYLHARVLLRRYRHLVENHGAQTLAFDGRDAISVGALVDELIEQMDMVYDHVVNDVTFAEDDAQWSRAKALFMNPNLNGHADGGVQYGLLLNSRGGAVMGFGNAPSMSSNLNVHNVYIHDLAVSPIEKLKFKTNPVGGATRGPVADVFDVMAVSSDEAFSRYVGSAYSDVQLAFSQFETDWFVLDHTCFDTGVLDWALNGVPFESPDDWFAGCNTDIQLHINKGVIGLRIDNVRGFDVNNVTIAALENDGILGSEHCGAYTQGNAHQDPLITQGYTGTEAYGVTLTSSTHGRVSDVKISAVTSSRGSVAAIAAFGNSSNVTMANVAMQGIMAGVSAEVADFGVPFLPNKLPQACSLYDHRFVGADVMSVVDVTAQDVSGFVLCDVQEMKGECDGCAARYDVGQWLEGGEFYRNGVVVRAKARTRVVAVVLMALSAVVVLVVGTAMLVLKQRVKKESGDESTVMLDGELEGGEYTPLLRSAQECY